MLCVIRVARGEENRVSVRRRRFLAVQPDAVFSAGANPPIDSFEFNKILGAILGTCLVLLTLNIAANALYSPHKPAKPGYEIAVQEQAPGGKPGEPAAADEPLPKRLASADVGRGEASAKKCAACHTFDKGGRNLVGPNLWGIVGKPKASDPASNWIFGPSSRPNN